MKMFLMTIVLSSLSSFAIAQSGNIATMQTNLGSGYDISKWRENLKITYLGEAIGASMQKWDDNQYDKYGNKTSSPASLWNNFGVRYKVLERTTVIFSPRFYTQIGDRNDLKPTEDQNVFVMDDFMYSISQQVYKGEKLSYGMRISHRNPDSTSSRLSQIKSQVEYQNDITWLPTAALSVLNWSSFRYYVYDRDRNEQRYRFNLTTLVNYSINDSWRVQMMHEWDMQHRAPKNGNSTRSWNHLQQYKDTVAFGVGYSIVPQLTVVPFLKLLNDQDIRYATTQVGFWVLGTIF